MRKVSAASMVAILAEEHATLHEHAAELS